MKRENCVKYIKYIGIPLLHICNFALLASFLLAMSDLRVYMGRDYYVRTIDLHSAYQVLKWMSTVIAIWEISVVIYLYGIRKHRAVEWGGFTLPQKIFGMIFLFFVGISVYSIPSFLIWRYIYPFMEF